MDCAPCLSHARRSVAKPRREFIEDKERNHTTDSFEHRLATAKAFVPRTSNANSCAILAMPYFQVLHDMGFDEHLTAVMNARISGYRRTKWRNNSVSESQMKFDPISGLFGPMVPDA